MIQLLWGHYMMHTWRACMKVSLHQVDHDWMVRIRRDNITAMVTRNRQDCRDYRDMLYPWSLSHPHLSWSCSRPIPAWPVDFQLTAIAVTMATNILTNRISFNVYKPCAIVIILLIFIVTKSMFGLVVKFLVNIFSYHRRAVNRENSNDLLTDKK